MRKGTKIVIWSAGVLSLLLLLVFIAAFFIDEPLRQRMQDNINRALHGYRVELPQLDFNPMGLSVSLRNLKLIQIAHPDPPIGRIENLKASVHWGALLNGNLVADFELVRPDFRIGQVQLRREAEGSRRLSTPYTL
jgi:hypothetical protein